MSENTADAAPAKRPRTDKQKANDSRLKEFWSNYHANKKGPVATDKSESESPKVGKDAGTPEPARRPVVSAPDAPVSHSSHGRRAAKPKRASGGGGGDSSGGGEGTVPAPPKRPTQAPAHKRSGILMF